MTGISVMMLVVLGSLSLLVAGIQCFDRTVSRTGLSSTNAQGIRRVSEAIRGAMTVSVSADGTQVTYTMPAISPTVDAITGEKELVDPLTSDGVNRSFRVDFTAGTLIDGTTGRVLVKNITRTDPDSKSSQYNQQYNPFQLTTIGSLRAVSINLITLERTQSGTRFVRLKNTASVRNAQ